MSLQGHRINDHNPENKCDAIRTCYVVITNSALRIGEIVKCSCWTEGVGVGVDLLKLQGSGRGSGGLIPAFAFLRLDPIRYN